MSGAIHLSCDEVGQLVVEALLRIGKVPAGQSFRLDWYLDSTTIEKLIVSWSPPSAPTKA